MAEKQSLLAEKQALLTDNKIQKKRVGSLEKKEEDDEIQIIEPPVRSTS